MVLSNSRKGTFESVSDSTLEGSFEEFQEVEWEEVSPAVREMNTSLHEVMEPIARKESKPKLYLASYPFGEPVVEGGTFKGPCGHFHGHDNLDCNCSRVWETISYPIPLSLVLDGTFETFDTVSYKGPRKDEESVAPLRLLRKGSVFGDFESLDDINFEGHIPPPSWSVMAGARSVYLQLKTGNNDFWDQLRIQLKAVGAEGIPHSLRFLKSKDDYKKIRYIVRKHPGMGRPSRILIIPTEWFVGGDVERRRFRYYLYKSAWKKSRHLRHGLSRTIGRFTDIEEHRQYTPFLQHLLLVTEGELPVFRPSTMIPDSPTGPLFQVQEFLDRVVGNMGIYYEDYYPVILQPSYLERKGTTGYCSLRVLTIKNPIGSVENFSADYALPTVKYFSPADPEEPDKEQRLDRFGLEELRVFHSGHEAWNLLEHKSTIEEEHAEDFIPEGKEEKTLTVDDGTFLSTCARLVRS